MNSHPFKTIPESTLGKKYPKMNDCASKCFKNSLPMLTSWIINLYSFVPVNTHGSIPMIIHPNIAKKYHSFINAFSHSSYFKKLNQFLMALLIPNLTEDLSTINFVRPLWKSIGELTKQLDFLTKVPNLERRSWTVRELCSSSHYNKQWVLDTDLSSTTISQSEFLPTVIFRLFPSPMI